MFSESALNESGQLQYDGPITDVTSNDIICNNGTNPYVTPLSQTIIIVNAGEQVGAQWNHVLQPNGYNPSDSQDPIDPSHLGPGMAYLAK
jgi:cellulase